MRTTDLDRARDLYNELVEEARVGGYPTDPLWLACLRLEKAERALEELRARQAAFAAGYEPPALEDDTPLAREDVEELVDQANRLRGDRPGGAIEIPNKLEAYEVIVSRSEVVAYASEIRRLWVERDALTKRVRGEIRRLWVERDELKNRVRELEEARR